MAAAKNMLEKLLDLAGEFVTEQKGAWEHDDWEAFLAKATKTGVEMDDESKRNLGNILEASKYFYQMMPPAPAPQQKTKAKTKAKAKPRPKA